MKIPMSANLRPLISGPRNGVFIKHGDGSYTNRSSMPIVLPKNSRVAHHAIIEPGQRFKPTSNTGHFEGIQPVNSFYVYDVETSRDIDFIKHVIKQTGLRVVVIPGRTVMDYAEIRVHKSNISKWGKSIVVFHADSYEENGPCIMAEILPDGTDREFFVGYVILELRYVHALNEDYRRYPTILDFEKFMAQYGLAYDREKFVKVRKKALSKGVDLARPRWFDVAPSVATSHVEI